jgi:hypothetical protein
MSDGAHLHAEPAAHEPADLHGGHGAADVEPLGPIDPLAWGAGAMGVVLGLVIAACFALATSGLGAF